MREALASLSIGPGSPMNAIETNQWTDSFVVSRCRIGSYGAPSRRAVMIA
jgi:aromatic ring-opening dioxygenase catalytic subunit (LigB family)